MIIRLKHTHQEFGDMIGSNQEAPNRAVSGLLNAKVARFAGKHIEIINMAGLRKEAELPFDWRNVSTDTTSELIKSV